MRIGIDAMGGDFAPQAIVEGVMSACSLIPEDVTIVLFGDKNAIDSIFSNANFSSDKIEVIPTTQVISMSDHPAKAFSSKPDSSIAVGFSMLKDGQINSFASAGNTGAMMVGTMYTIKAVPGILRPCITSPLAKYTGGAPTTILDVGLNSDCKPDVLYQYGILGSIYASCVYNIEKPRVALLNIGEEEEKGNLLTKATHELMKDSKEFNFIGNIESNHLYEDHADVVVCDGFTGNIVLKQAEALYKIAEKLDLKHHDFLNQFNYENIGGTPILGVNAPVLIGHGISNGKAIESIIMRSIDIVRSNLTEKIKQAFK
jgi:glycerol-3-phosphate acyltransferase PlsX